MHQSSRKNARGADRYDTTLFANVEGDTSFREYRGNISSGGFCFQSDQELPPGTCLRIVFRLPGAGYWMQASGVVLGCVSSVCTVGIRGRFTEVQVGDVDHMTKWLDSALLQVA